MAALSTAQKLDWLQLARSRGMGPAAAAKLLEHFGTAAKVLETVPRLVGAGRLRDIRICRRDEAEAELEALAAIGADVLVKADPVFPEALAAIPDAPLVLAMKGRAEMLKGAKCAIVGARNASHNGRLLAMRMAEATSRAGFCIVSGLARGIDTAGHEGGLSGGGGTIAVIASGLDIVYPIENADLAARIVEDGLILSEWPLGTAPMARHFPRRNRIIAGLSAGVLVVEAAERSGSLMTARLAGEYGREVMAVPGSPLDPRHIGTNRLIREGAHLIERPEDILAALPQNQPAPQIRRRATRTPRGVPAPARPAKSEIATPTAAPPSAGPLAERLLEAMSAEPLLVDELVRRCHASAAEVQDALLDLELDGRISRHPGNRVALAWA